MKYRISLAVNFLLLLVTVCLAASVIRENDGRDHYRHIVGGIADKAASELAKGHAESVRQALETIPQFPHLADLQNAYLKLEEAK